MNLQQIPVSVQCMLMGCLVVLLPGCSGKKTEAERSTVGNDTTQVAAAPASSQLPLSQELDIQTYVVHQNVDTAEVQLILTTCLVELPPTEEEQAEAQSDNTIEEFATSADDYYFYFSSVIHRLAPMHISIVQASRRYLRFQVDASVSLLVDTKVYGKRSWNPILFKKGTLPVILDLVGEPDTTRVQRYFGS